MINLLWADGIQIFPIVFIFLGFLYSYSKFIYKNIYLLFIWWYILLFLVLEIAFFLNLLIFWCLRKVSSFFTIIFLFFRDLTKNTSFFIYLWHFKLFSGSCLQLRVIFLFDLVKIHKLELIIFGEAIALKSNQFHIFFLFLCVKNVSLIQIILDFIVCVIEIFWVNWLFCVVYLNIWKLKLSLIAFAEL